ncbi:MAG TPA: ATP-binding protein [Chryseosolibacter sp.]|nr:ATP-binding protein [Chryseosolibacter sp.]
MFFRAHEHTDGAGLGLYIVQEAVQKLQGTIEVTSQEKIGTTFTIKLPIFKTSNN